MMPFLLSRCAALAMSAFLLGAAAEASACSGKLHIEVQESGVYTLDYATLTAQQPKLADCASDALVLTNRGREVPLRIVDDGHGRLARGSRIEWLGEALHGPQSWFDQYSSVNVYQLSAASGAHARVREPQPPQGSPVGLRRRLHFEQENLLLRLSDSEMKPGDEPDVWQWAKLTPVDAQPFAYEFDLPDLDLDAAARKPAVLSLDFRGMSNLPATVPHGAEHDHEVEIALGGKPLARLAWDGRREFRRDVELPRALMKAAGNRLEIRVPKRPLPGDANFIIDVVMLNWMEVAYPIRGDLSASTAAFAPTEDGAMALSSDAAPELFGSDGSYQHPTAIERGRYRAAGRGGVEYYALTTRRAPGLVRAVADADPRTDEGGYDYLIVAHPRLLDAIRPLADFHRQRGLKVAVYNVDDVYDAFNGGIVHPSAIRDLVAWGVAHWTVKPRYLLLVGDASFDIHHDQRSNRGDKHLYAAGPDLPPPQMMEKGGFFALGSTSYSEWDQALPNRNLIPTWQYPSPEGQSASDNGFVALRDGDVHPSVAVGRLPVVEPAEVKAIVDKTIEYSSKPAPGDWRRDVAFISTNEVPAFKATSESLTRELEHKGFAVDSVYTNVGEKDQTRYQGARQTLKRMLDAGDLIVHFMGHGGQYIWRVGPIGDLFNLDDVSALTNAGRYPLVLAMTCFSAPFDHPTEDSIGERFLREPNRGAVAVFAASWTNWPNPDNSRALIDELLKPGQTIGDAILKVKQRSADKILVEMYNLLGDPALVLAQPSGSLAFARGADRWDRRMIVRIGEAGFAGEVAVDWSDDAGNAVSSHRYESRDAQFSLSIPERAAWLRVFAADPRTGYTAFGAWNLLQPPPASSHAAAPARPAAPRQPRKVDPHDDISSADFETAPSRAPAASP